MTEDYLSFFSQYVENIKCYPRSSQATGRCCFHEDKLSSFSLNLATGLWTCHACNISGNAKTFARRLGLPSPDKGPSFRPGASSVITVASQKAHDEPLLIAVQEKEKKEVVARYVYTDENAQPLFRVNRTNPKGFFQQRYENGRWVSGLGQTRRVIYNLPAVLKSDQTIFFVEGEKDAERLGNLSLVATTSPMGAGSWDTGFATYFVGKRVAAIPDNDAAGREFINKVARDLLALQVPVKIVVLPGVPEKGDVSDFLDSNGNNVSALLDLVKRTVPERIGRNENKEPIAYFKSFGIDLPPPSSLLPTEYALFSQQAYRDVASTLDTLTDDGLAVLEKLDAISAKRGMNGRDYAQYVRLLMDLHQVCHV